MPAASVELRAVSLDDADALADLRVAAMRASLEAAGRFDADRARNRFLANFVPQFTRHIVVAGERVGFVVVRPAADELLLDHLYVVPPMQGRGIGAAVLAVVFAEADAERRNLRVGALKGSRSNAFYQRHGFRLIDSGEWDLYYVRRPCGA